MTFEIKSEELIKRQYEEKVNSFIKGYIRLRGYVINDYGLFRKKGMKGFFQGNLADYFFDKKTNILLITTFGHNQEIVNLFREFSNIEFAKQNNIKVIVNER
jgi:hypothetical protein